MPWFAAFGCAIVLPGALLHAQVPQLLNYQGRVAVGTVNPVNFNGTGTFKFALVNNTGTTTFWSNDGSSVAGSEPTLAVSLPVTKGLYSVLLGDTTVPGMTFAIPASVWTNADVRLRVWFNDGTNGSQLLTPDQRLAPNGYLPAASVSSAALASGAVTSVKLASGLTLAGTTTGTFGGNLTGNATTATTALSATTAASATTAGSATNFTGALAGNVTGPQAATVVATVGGVTAANVAAGANLANAATNANTANTIVKRDASGNFSAGTITGTFSGNGAGLTNIPGSALGSTLSLGGTLNLPPTTSPTVGAMTQGGTSLLHTFGARNFFAGTLAGNYFMTGGDNTASGYATLFSNSTGSGNTASGSEALSSNTTGNNNTAVGQNALQINTTGFYNTAIGSEALQLNTTGTSNTVIGALALSVNITGAFNTASGSAALSSNTTGSGNVASGSAALPSNTTGGYNAALGSGALYLSTTGYNNTAVGNSALENNTTGGYNIALGSQAGRNLTTGSDNIDIGNPGVAAESGIIRIGTTGTHTDTYLTGVIHGDMTRFGSGAGTAEVPDRPLVIRRAKSTSSTAGQVVARTDKLSLERDGSDAGWRISYAAFSNNSVVAFTGLTSSGVTVNSVKIIDALTIFAGTVSVYTNAQDLISIRGTFGNSYNALEQTEVSLTRHPVDNFWIGTITSTVNQ